MNENTNTKIENAPQVDVSSHVFYDLRTAVLIVSVVANLFVFTTWLALQVTSQYDASLAAFLFNR